MISNDDLELLQKEARQDGVDILVGALIMRSDGRIFGFRRSMERKLFPGCWDIAGGHVERGEFIVEALEREIAEETGWELEQIVDLVGTFEWMKNYGAITKKVREFEFLVRVRDEARTFVAEEDYTTECHWFALNDLDRLMENRTAGDNFMYRVFKQGFERIDKLRSCSD
jgi:8-oxo-dGTP pyrophosphatase MutT (NUDIX family)